MKSCFRPLQCDRTRRWNVYPVSKVLLGEWALLLLWLKSQLFTRVLDEVSFFSQQRLVDLTLFVQDWRHISIQRWDNKRKRRNLTRPLPKTGSFFMSGPCCNSANGALSKVDCAVLERKCKWWRAKSQSHNFWSRTRFNGRNWST